MANEFFYTDESALAEHTLSQEHKMNFEPTPQLWSAFPLLNRWILVISQDREKNINGEHLINLRIADNATSFEDIKTDIIQVIMDLEVTSK